MENQTIAYKLVSEYHNVITGFYEGLMLGCNGQCYSRLYLDLHSKEIFQNVEASCNTWLAREDNSLSEIAHDDGFGADLSNEEVEYLKENGVSDFGFADWIDGYLIPNIANALDDWDNRGKEQV